MKDNTPQDSLDPALIAIIRDIGRQEVFGALQQTAIQSGAICPKLKRSLAMSGVKSFRCSKKPCGSSAIISELSNIRPRDSPAVDSVVSYLTSKGKRQDLKQG